MRKDQIKMGQPHVRHRWCKRSGSTRSPPLRKRCDSADSAEAEGIGPLVKVTMHGLCVCTQRHQPDFTCGLLEQDSA